MENIVLESYEGPLDLLLHLIKDHKINIHDIPIFTITRQYLDYLNKMNEYNIEVASEFLVIASTLIAIKVKMLLPKEVDEATGEVVEDPRLELVSRLLEYERFKDASETIAYLFSKQGKSYYRERDEELYERLGREVNSLEKTSPRELHDLMNFVLEREVERVLPPYEVKTKQVSIGERIRELIGLLEKTPVLYFSELVGSGSRTDVVSSFLALLDLYRQEKVSFFQMDSFSPLKITYRKEEDHAI